MQGPGYIYSVPGKPFLANFSPYLWEGSFQFYIKKYMKIVTGDEVILYLIQKEKPEEFSTHMQYIQSFLDKPNNIYVLSEYEEKLLGLSFNNKEECDKFKLKLTNILNDKTGTENDEDLYVLHDKGCN